MSDCFEMSDGSRTPDRPDASTRFEIRADARRYEVRIASGAAAGFLERLGGDTIVICDAIFAERLAALPCPVLSLPALETSKTLTEAGRLVEEARRLGLTRGGRIVAVGGGIIQDVACFVSSFYMRGVAWCYLPTTVLGMVDSCIGGKSSINVGPYKNLGGTMHPPELVLVDPDFAATLAMEHRAGGLCEAAKITFARGGDSFGRYLEQPLGPDLAGPALAAVVELSLQAKRWFVETDEFDRAERLTLNFGHTFGHALESASGFAINHGAAVGLGILCALDFARARGLAVDEDGAGLRDLGAHVAALLGRVPGLAAAFAAVDVAAFERAFLSDKKHGADHLALVLPVEAGGLPLSVCRLPRDAATLAAVVAAVKRTQRTIA